MSWTQKALDHFTDVGLTALASHTPDLGSAWVQDSGAARIDVNGDHLQITADGYARNSTTLANDQAVEIKNTSTGTVEVFLRYNGNAAAPTGYLLEVRNGFSYRLWKFSTTGDPRQTQLASGGTGAQNDVARCEVVGTTFTVYRNGASLFTATDGSYGSGFTGVYSAAGTGAADDFAAYEQAAGTAYYLAGGVGTFTLAGGAAGQPIARKLVGSSGACSLSGGAAGLVVARMLAGGSGAYVVAGGVIFFPVSRVLAGVSGTFVLSGGSAGLSVFRVLVAAPGSFASVGGNAFLTTSRVLVGATGVFTLTGGDAWTPLPAPPSEPLAPSVTGLREGSGAAGGYLVPPEWRGVATPGTRRGPELPPAYTRLFAESRVDLGSGLAAVRLGPIGPVHQIVVRLPALTVPVFGKAPAVHLRGIVSGTMRGGIRVFAPAGRQRSRPLPSLLAVVVLRTPVILHTDVPALVREEDRLLLGIDGDFTGLGF